MKNKLFKHGKSRAIVIAKPILDSLSITDDTVLNIKTDGDTIIIQPIRPKRLKISSNKKEQKIYEEIVAKYAPALKKLAKN